MVVKGLPVLPDGLRLQLHEQLVSRDQVAVCRGNAVVGSTEAEVFTGRDALCPVLKIAGLLLNGAAHQRRYPVQPAGDCKQPQLRLQCADAGMVVCEWQARWCGMAA